MKTLQLKTLPILLVELPEWAIFEGYSPKYGDIIYRNPHGIKCTSCITVEDVSLVGKLSDLPYEWFEQHVEEIPPLWYKKYTVEKGKFVPSGYTPVCHDPRTSFYTLLEAKEQVYLNGNPYRDYTRYIAGSNPYVVTKERYNEAQSRTFDPERTYLFTIKNQ